MLAFGNIATIASRQGLLLTIDRSVFPQQLLLLAAADLAVGIGPAFSTFLILQASNDFGPPRAHLRLPQLPTSPDDIRLGRFAEVWSALSVGLLLITTIIIGLISRQWWIGLLSMLGIFAFLEALFKRRAQNFISNFVVGLALLTMLVLLIEFFKPVIVVLALLTGLLIIIDNARELRTS